MLEFLGGTCPTPYQLPCINLQESFTTVTEEPINVVEYDIMSELDFAPTWHGLPKEPELFK